MDLQLRRDGEEIKKIVGGITRRVGAESIPLTPDQLHRLIRDGHSPVSQRLTEIEEKVDGLLGRHSGGATTLHERQCPLELSHHGSVHLL